MAHPHARLEARRNQQLRFPVCQAKEHSARTQSTSLRAHEHARVHTSKLNARTSHSALRTSHFALFSIVEHHCTAPCTCQLKTPLPPFSESSRHWIALLQYVNAALNMVHDLAVGHSKELRAVAGMLNRTRTSWRIYIELRCRIAPSAGSTPWSQTLCGV